MSSRYSPLVHPSESTHENPTLLTISRADPDDANCDRLPRSLFGTKLSSHGQRSAQADISRLGIAYLGKNFGCDNVEFGANLERSRLGDKTGGICVQNAEEVEIDANMDRSGLEFEPRSYGGGQRPGGKLRTSHRNSKRTPYERPVIGRHATAGGSGAPLQSAKKVTVASRLRDSASRLIYSSVSFLFPALFKHSPVAIKDNGKYQGVNNPVEQELSEGMPDSSTKQNGPNVLANEVPALQDADVKTVELENGMLEIGQVEEVLKQKTWSRDQVNRLTEILQKQVSETDNVNIGVEGKTIQEQSTLETKGASPIEVAQAYMGEQAPRPSGLAATVQGSIVSSSQVQSSFGHTLVEDRYPASPFSRGWPRGSASKWIPKRSLAIEDDVISMGTVRRVRQKMSMPTTASPYRYPRRMTGISKPSETCMLSPPLQSSQTAMKILETLEKLSPSPQGKLPRGITKTSENGFQILDKFSPHKGKSSNDPLSVDTVSRCEHSPQISEARDKIVASLGVSQKSAEPKVNGRPTLDGGKLTEAEVNKSLVTPSSLPQPHNFSVFSKGFRMNAVFEDTNSDEDAKSQVELMSSNVAKDQPATLKHDAVRAPASFIMPHTTVNAYQESIKSLSSSPSFSFCSATGTSSKLFDAAGSSAAAATVSLPEQKGRRALDLTALKPATSSTFPNPSAASVLKVMSEFLVTTASASESTLTALPVASSTGLSSSGNAPTATAGLSFSGSSPLDVSGVSSPILTTLSTNINPSQSENLVYLATESPTANKQAQSDTMGTDNIAEEAETFMVSSPAFPVPKLLFDSSSQPSMKSTFLLGTGSSGTFLSTSDISSGAGSSRGSAGASASSLSSPFSFGALSVTTLAPNSISGASPSLPYVPALTFGGQSSTLSSGQTPVFALGICTSLSSSSASPFAFGAQSATTPTGQERNMAVSPVFGVSTSSASSAFNFPFGSQSGTASTGQEPNAALKPLFGQLSANSCGPMLSVGALPSSAGSPFQSTGRSSHGFLFGLSNAAMFEATSASSPMSSVSFADSSSKVQSGAPGITSSFISGPATSSTTSSFPTLPAPSVSVTPTFSLSGAAASSHAAGAATSAITQPSGFGAAQLNPFTVNPFASSGTQNTSFSFRATSMMPAAPSSFSSASSSSSTSLFGLNMSSSAPSVFAFGSASGSSSPPFAFGSGQPSMSQVPGSVPFTFGNQPSAAPPKDGQPLGYCGGQPAAPTPAPDPYPAAGTAQLGLGFALGTTGGDRSGRKYIKAKRIGSTKKGK